MRIWLAVSLALTLVGCKTTQTTSAVDQTEAGNRGIQCGMRVGFSGMCQVIDVSGRLETTTEAARAARIGAIKALRFTIPDVAETDQARIVAEPRNGGDPLWTIEEALDLYNRRACIAQLSGGLFGEAYAPQLTIRTLFNVHDASQTGFAEISDYRGKKPEHATVTLRCDWQK